MFSDVGTQGTNVWYSQVVPNLDTSHATECLVSSETIPLSQNSNRALVKFSASLF